MSFAVARSRDLVLLVLAAASWGFGTVISKRAVGELPPLTLLLVQLAASVVLLSLLMRSRGLSLRGSPSGLARLGILNPGVAYALGLLGLTTISASLAVLLWALEPLLILLLAALVLRERIGVSVLAASGVALAGMSLIVFEPAIGGQWSGVVLTVAGVAVCACYTILARRWFGASDSTAQVVLAQQVHALGFVAVALLAVGLIGAPAIPTSVSTIGLLSALGSGVLYYAAAYWFYLSALRRVPASLAASSFYLIPVFGVAGGSILLADQLSTQQWAGVVIAVVAVVVVVSIAKHDAGSDPKLETRRTVG